MKDNQNDRVVECFNVIAEDYLVAYSETSLEGYVLRIRNDLALEFLAGTSGGAILDVGCGPGIMARDLLDRGFHYFGVDASPGMIALCRRRFDPSEGACFGVADATMLPFPDAAFDVVICTGVIGRIGTPERAMAEMGRVLRPSGALILSFGNLLSPYALWRGYIFYSAIGFVKWVLSLLGARERPQDLYLRTKFRLWVPRSASAAVSKLVGDVDDVAFYSFVPLLSPLDELLPGLALRLGCRLERLRNGRFRWLGAGFVVRAKKRM